MKRFQSILCASLLTLAFSGIALAGDIHGVTANSAGDIHGVKTSIAGDIHGVKISILVMLARIAV